MDNSTIQAYETFRSSVDVNIFSTLPYIRRIEKPWGWELHFTSDNHPYMGKIVHIKAGKRLSLQAHDVKRESWMKLSGDARMMLENAEGELETIVMEDNVGYSCQIGQRHRLMAGETDCEVVEVSTPEKGITYRLEDDFARPPAETDQERERRNRGEKVW